MVTTTRTHATITIKHAETIDCGQYTVKLSNQVSEISADFTVKIRGEETNQKPNHNAKISSSYKNLRTCTHADALEA